MTDDTPQPTTPRAVLCDYGGVLTTNLFASFAACSEAISGDPELIRRLLQSDPESSKLLVDAECGRLRQAEFETGLAARLNANGASCEAEGLLAHMMALTDPDEEMLATLRAVRDHGIPTAIVSNSLGDDAYRGTPLAELADVVVISGREGVRKPSRRLYQIACDRLGVEPPATVMIDDVDRNLAGAARLGIRGILHTDAASTRSQLEALFGVDLEG